MPLPLAGPLLAALLLTVPPGAEADAGIAEPPDAGAAQPAAALPAEAPAEQADLAPAEPAPEDLPEPPADLPDDPSTAQKIDEAAREMEELRAAEAAALDEGAKRAAEVFGAVRQTGLGNPLHERLSDALGADRALPVAPDAHEIEAAALAELGAFDIERAKKLYDIPVELHPLVAEYIRLFQGPLRKHFLKWVGRSFHYLPMMKQALREAGLPVDTVYLSMIESGFAPVALSRAKASGLWQFIEPTGKRFGLRVDFWLDERRDPVKSTYAAAAYLKELYTEFGDWRLAWAGYNSGAGTVRKAIRLSGSNDFWVQIETKKAYKQETRHYVPKLMAAALLMKHLKQFGFDEKEYLPGAPLAYEDVEVPEATDLDVIARAAGVGVEQLKELNPALRRWCTPPSRNTGDVYKVHLPVGAAERFAQEFPKIAPKDRLYYAVHVVTKGDTLSKIAARYGSATEAIMRMNNLRDSRRLKMKAELIVPVPRGGGREALALSARKQGYKAAPAGEEIPAEPPPPRRSKSGVAAGTVRTVQEGGRTKTIYAVASGDSLWSIARRFDVTVAQIKDWNGFGAPAPKLRIGEELTLYAGEKPAGSAKPSEAKRGSSAPTAPSLAAPQGKKSVVHVVAAGDTLSSVARQYKVALDDLLSWNRLTPRKKLKIGQRLTVFTSTGSHM